MTTTGHYVISILPTFYPANLLALHFPPVFLFARLDKLAIYFILSYSSWDGLGFKRLAPIQMAFLHRNAMGKITAQVRQFNGEEATLARRNFKRRQL